MSEKTVNLNAVRAARKGDARLLSVKDCLEEALFDAGDERWDKCLLIFRRLEDDGSFYIDQRVAGCTTLEVRGLAFTWMREEILGKIEDD